MDGRAKRPGHEIPDPVPPRRASLRKRLRAVFIAGAEEDSRRRLGRGLTAEELERVLRHYPGDVWLRPLRRRLGASPTSATIVP